MKNSTDSLVAKNKRGKKMEIQNTIAVNAKNLRSQKGLTLEEAAKLTGVSKSMLAQIEKGDVNPTISVLWKIANGYKVSFSSLIDQAEQESEVIRFHEITPLTDLGDGYINYPTFPFREDRLFETYQIKIEAGGSLKASPHLAGTEEYLTIFSGKIEVTAADEVFVLGCGDSLHFRADVPHGYRNIGDTTVMLHMILYYS